MSHVTCLVCILCDSLLVSFLDLFDQKEVWCREVAPCFEIAAWLVFLPPPPHHTYPPWAGVQYRKILRTCVKCSYAGLQSLWYQAFMKSSTIFGRCVDRWTRSPWAQVNRVFSNKLVAPFESLANIESENIIFFTDNNSNNPSLLYFILHESY